VTFAFMTKVDIYDEKTDLKKEYRIVLRSRRLEKECRIVLRSRRLEKECRIVLNFSRLEKETETCCTFVLTAAEVEHTEEVAQVNDRTHRQRTHTGTACV
jgi:hypothetical protein